MSYCSENNTRCDRSRFMTSMGATASAIPVPIFAPGTLAIAELQIAINRIQPGYPNAYKLLVVDGKLGPATQTAINFIHNMEILGGGDISVTPTVLNMLADQRGLPQLPLQPMGPFAIGDKTAPAAPPAGTPGLPQPGMASTTMIALAAVGVGVVLALTSKKGRKR